MSRVFPSQNEKREIRISIGNKNSRSKISVPTAKCERKIIFKKKSAKKSHSSQVKLNVHFLYVHCINVMRQSIF